MTAYNVVNRSLLQAGQLEDISQVVANFDAIAAVVNGNLDDSNVKVGANLAIPKLNGYPTDATKFLQGNGVWAVQPNIVVHGAPISTLGAPGFNDIAQAPFIPAGVLINRGSALRVTINGWFLNNSGATTTLQLQAGYISSGVVMPYDYDSVTAAIATSANPRSFFLQLLWEHQAATASAEVRLSGILVIGNTTAPTKGYSALSAAPFLATSFSGNNTGYDLSGTATHGCTIVVTHTSNANIGVTTGGALVEAFI